MPMGNRDVIVNMFKTLFLTHFIINISGLFKIIRIRIKKKLFTKTAKVPDLKR